MSAPTASLDRSVAEPVLEAELAVIRCLHAAVVHDPFWESVTLRHEGPELTITVVNLVDYEPHTRSDGDFGPQLLHPVQREIELLRRFRATGDDVEVIVNPVLVTVYRDSVPGAGEPTPSRPSLAA